MTKLFKHTEEFDFLTVLMKKTLLDKIKFISMVLRVNFMTFEYENTLFLTNKKKSLSYRELHSPSAPISLLN